MMLNQPNPETTIHILQKDIRLQMCPHINDENVEEDLVLYKIVNDIGKREFFGTCSLCYMTKISKKHPFKKINKDNID